MSLRELVHLAIVVDETHLLAKDATLPRLMKEGRKFGISVILASQGMKDFNPDVIDNSGSRIVFRTNHPASKKVSEFLSAPKTDDLKQRVEQLAVGTAYVQTSEMQYSAIVDMQPPLAGRNGAVALPR
jgi:DNA helicase HerA-like ATPase